MSETTQRRLPFLPFLVLLLALGPTVGARPGTPPRPAATPLATPTATVPVGWPEVERLIGEQKFAEALSAVESLEAAARQAGDAAGWTKALIRATQLRIGLHGYETAVRALREASWPDDAASRAALDLCYAHALTTYLDAYSWEIHRREAVASTGPLDLESWTAAMITAEAEGAYLEVWQRRAALGTTPVTSLAEVLEPNSYPVEVRGTLRDAVSYLYAGLLADTSGWTPEQENELFRLDLARLLADGAATGAVTADAAAHPLSRLVAVLADLERWHHDGRRPTAALEARLERTRRLHAALSDDDDRRAIRADLERRLDAYRGEPWWAEGMAVLAELTATDPAADALVRARELAQAGLDAYRGTPGGLHCESIVAGIGAPAVEVRSMAADGPQRRSLEVTHKNLKELHFRAYADDLARRLETSDDYNLLPDADDIRRLVDGATPVASWKVNLPATPDFREHRSFVTPPLSAPGFYVLVAAPDPALSGVRGPVVATTLLVSDLVLLSRTTADGAIEARVVAGASGVPQGGVRVDLYRRDWQRGHRAAASATTGADGWVGFPLGSLDEGRSYFLLARRGAQVALDSDGYWLSRPGRPTRETAALLFTDRSIYRPGQRLFWKVLAWQGDRETGKLRTAAGEVVTVTLRDANGEEVTNRSVTTSSFGSASGDFELPAGRLLGGWRLDSTLGGGVVVRVEEYKRPTFEVEVADPSTPLRLNREARLVGTARYYFGLPVTEGGVRWRVVREPVWPRWWWWWGERKVPQTVAAGTARLDADGAFAVVFTPAADERLGREVSYRYLLSADVTDAGGETRSATRSFRLGFVAVEASVSAARGFFTAGEPVELVVSRASLDGQPRPGSGSWTLVGLRQPARPLLPADLPPRRSRPTPEPVLRAGGETITTQGDAQRPRWETDYAPEEVLRSWPDGREVATGGLEHAALSATVTLAPLPAGAYRLRYRTTDEYGAACEAQHEFVVASPSGTVALPALLLAENNSVPVGGTARLLALSGLPGQPLLLEVFRGGQVVERRSLVAGRDATLIEIPVREADRGGFSVALSTVADHQLVQLQQTVSVPWDDRRLEVSFSTFRDLLRPGQRETWRITVRGADGAPLPAGAAELLATMIDRSLEAFVPHRFADPLSLYPDRTGVRPLRASLGEAHAQWLRGSFPAPPSPPDLRGDRVKVLDGYGIGGPGRRGRPVGGVMALESRAMAPPPAAAKGQRAEAETDLAADRAEPAATPAPAVELRSEFAETAFWQPQLLTGADGAVAVEFTVPDSLTAWNVMVGAVTRDLRAGSLSAQARTVKELMVRPYLPRFLREGDRAEIRVVVNNAAARELEGEVVIDLIDPASGESVLGRFGVGDPLRRFTVAPAAGATVAYQLAAPAGVGTVAVKVTARSGDLGDGELRPLPLLPSRLHLAQSRFAALRGDEKRTLRFADLERADDPTRANERLVVTVDGQLFDGVLAALPYLVQYPYECTEQTLNRFLSTGIVSAVFEKYPAVARRAAELSARETRLETFDGADPNRRMGLEETPWLQQSRGGGDEGLDLVNVLDARVARAERASALAKLVRAQTSNGGFPWFPGGPPSPYMTVYVLYGFAKAAEFGVEVPREPIVRGWGYLAEYVREELARAAKDDCCWQLLTFINYVASCYPDPAWLGDALSEDDRRRVLELSLRRWKEHSPYLKGALALTLARADRGDDARRVWDSVMDSARTETDLGTFWAPEDRAWLWYNDTIETHAFALRVLLEIAPQDARRHGLVHWLFLNKKLNQWKSTRATAEVIYALVHYLDAEGALSGREQVDVAIGGRSASFVFEPDAYTGKRNQLVLEGAQVTPAAATIGVSKQGAGMAFASATWHFATDRLPERGDGDLFRVERRYFRRDRTVQGPVLTPLAEGAAIAVGDEVEVQLSVRAAHAAEYVHLRDPRPAGCEPATQMSGWRWDLGLVRYEEIRDSGTNFFFEWLPAGEYTLIHRLRAATAGTFRVAPATLQSMYAPEFAAHSAGASLAIAGR